MTEQEVIDKVCDRMMITLYNELDYYMFEETKGGMYPCIGFKEFTGDIMDISRPVTISQLTQFLNENTQTIEPKSISIPLWNRSDYL